MITRKKRLSLSHSSPKTPATKSCHSLSKEAVLNSPIACLTPTRPKIVRPSVVDESPTLSQDPMTVTWQWGSESPVRANTTKGLMRPLRNAVVKRNKLNREKSKMLADKAAIDSAQESPRGLYKFQEEMRRIHEETDNACDIEYSDDPGYSGIDTSGAMLIGNDSFSLSPIRRTEIDEPTEIKSLPDSISAPGGSNTTLTAIKNDLFNDSDFDQELATCSLIVEKYIGLTPANAMAENVLIDTVTKPSEKTKVPVASDETRSERAQDSSLKNTFFDNDESIDNILSCIDDSFITNSVNKLNNSKFLRHNSMPPRKEQPIPPTRKSFSRHESMPVSSAQIAAAKKLQKASNSSQSSTESTILRSSSTSTVTLRCTAEEIAEKRRQALERLKKSKIRNKR